MPLLARFVMKHGASPQEAADAAHEAFATAYPQWDSIRFPARWLRTVAVRVYFRAKLREDLLGHLPPPLNQPGIRMLSWPHPNHFQPIHRDPAAMQLRELRWCDMKRATRGPQEDQGGTPAVRTVTEKAGYKTHLRPLIKPPGFLSWLSAARDPRQQSSNP
ncbi:hypothetical protein ACGFYU_37700 [Streptomyces sp. NPDC048337]|uniref:hypothetical protein n=1 Tax=Streptomyces sp. NPDC048337 TaxID=3365535 RepID=UPI0037222854